MEELQMLVTMVAGLPTLTVWVLAGYLAYKLAVIGSIYGVIRLAINRYYDYKAKPVVTTHKLAGRAIDDDTLAALQIQVGRVGGNGGYFHMSDVSKLRRALDMIDKGEVK